MRLFGRNDLVLLLALPAALFVVFANPLGRLLEYTHEIEESSGLQLLPALVILATVFLIHQVRKRTEIQAEAAASAAAARQATERAAEMERLVAFGQALARSLDHASIRDAVAAHLPLLAVGRGAWVLVRPADVRADAADPPRHQPFTTLTVVGDSTAEQRERMARRALGEADPLLSGPPDDICFPMILAGRPIGVLAVSPLPAPTDQQRSVLAAAAALLAVSLKNAELFLEVHENSVRDALTGCCTRKHALDVIEAELRRARRSQLPVSLVMFDLDHFKHVNDTHGHLAGDAVLSAIGARMRSVLRGSDLKCRYGGDEFMVILPDTPLLGAKQVSENLRRAIAEHPVSWNDGQVMITASFGITSINRGENDPLGAISRADTALYRAKQRGRNGIELEELPEALAS